MGSGRILRRLGLVLAGLLGLAVASVALLPTLVRGQRFAWVVGRLLPPTLGQISLGGGRLSAGAVFALLTGHPFFLELDQLRVRDPEGTTVLSAAHLSAEIVFHRHPDRIVVSELRPGRATWRLGRMQHHPGIGFVAAFLSPARPGRRGLVRPGAEPVPLVFQIASADLDGLDAVFDFPSWGLELANVKAAGSLLADTRDPERPVFAFDVHGIDARAGGTLRILDGAGAARLPFEKAHIRRVAITPDHQDDLTLAVDAALTGRSRLSGEATFGGVVGIPGQGSAPGLAVNVTLASPAEAMAALGVGTRLGPVSAVGAGGTVGLRVEGPYEHLTAALSAHDLDLAYGGRGIGRAQLEATASLGPLQADIRQLELTAPGGGRINVRGSLNQALELTGGVRFRRVATEGYLPSYLRQAGGGVLDGEVQIKGGLVTGAAAVSRLDLAWQRPPGTPGPRVIRLRSREVTAASGAGVGLTVNAPGLQFADGVLTLRRLSLPLLGGRVSVDGRVQFWRGQPPQLFASPLVALDVRADGVDVDRAGLGPLIGGRLDVSARLRGSLDRLAVRLRFAPSSRLVILGEMYTTSAPVEARVENSELFVASLPLEQVGAGKASHVELRGRIGLSGTGDVLLTASDHDLFGLPGLRDAGLPMRGLFDARLRLQGRLNDPALSGEVTIKDVALGNQLLGGGALVLEAAGHRAARVRGTLFESFAVDGTLANRLGQPLVDLAVSLDRAKLDPLLPTLPPLLGAGHATATGRVSMQIREGRPVVFDAHFTDLGVSYQLRSAGQPPRLGIRSVGPVDAHMVGWGTELTLAEAGFDFGAGSLRVAGTVRRGVLSARAHGPIDLAFLAPVFDAALPDQLVELRGLAAADVQLGGTLAAPRVQGRLGVVRAVEVGLRAFPGAHLRVGAGSLLLEGTDSVRLDGALATVHFDDAATFTNADATLRLDVRLGSGRQPGQPSLNGEVTIVSAQVTSLALGDTVRVRDARLTASDGTLTLRSLEAVSDHHGRLTLGGLGAPPVTATIASMNPFAIGAIDVAARGRGIAYGPEAGLKIDDMDVSLRLQGDLRQKLALRGEVTLGAGHYQADAAKPAPPALPGRASTRSSGQPAPPSLRERIALDVRLRCDGQRFVIKHRIFPDLRVRLDVHAGGTAAAPRITGSAGSTGLYSWLALLLVRPFR